MSVGDDVDPVAEGPGGYAPSVVQDVAAGRSRIAHWARAALAGRLYQREMLAVTQQLRTVG